MEAFREEHAARQVIASDMTSAESGTALTGRAFPGPATDVDGQPAEPAPRDPRRQGDQPLV
jgi:hypothetical protein